MNRAFRNPHGQPRTVAHGTRCFVSIAALFLACAQSAHAQPSASATTVVARVNGQPIYVIEVEQQLELVLRGRTAEPEALKLLQAQAIEQLISRRLILEQLAEKKMALNEKEIDVEVERIRKRLAITGVKLEDHLAKTQQDLASLRRSLAWQHSWQRYLNQFLSAENLKKYYQQRQRDFDGSQVSVAHILLKVENAEDSAAVAAATKKLADVAAEIAAGKLTFEAAAAKHSQSPTAADGGKIGFIERHDAMPESFAKAAFALKPNEVSKPVATGFGVHLIKCLEIKPGQRQWHEIEPEVRQAATAYAFDWLADRRRSTAKIEYTGALPHFKPGTKEIDD
jgi:parvulin-like peptidyl-prolyl isomerase